MPILWSSLLKRAAPYLLVTLTLVGGVLYLYHWGDKKFEAGRESMRLEIEKESARLTTAMQKEKDDAEAKYRGAVLARQAIEKSLVDRDKRINSLLAQLRAKSTQMAQTSSGIDGTSADWVGIFGACYAEYSRVGTDAAEFADKINGLQLYIRAVTEVVK